MTTPLIGAGLFAMELDLERLPVRVIVSRHLNDELNPHDFSAAAMTGYIAAMWHHDAPAIERGDFKALSSRPPRRTQLITMLDSANATEVEAIEAAINGDVEYTATGPLTEYGEPSLRIRANLGRLTSINIDPRWASISDPAYIGYDLIECANEIRKQRPVFHDTGSWSIRSDEELEAELIEYNRYLGRSF